MAILGNIIKGAIHLREAFTQDRDHWQEQLEVLHAILNTAQETDFGQFYNFEYIMNASNIPKAFAEKIPYHDYNKINGEWWYKLHEGYGNVTWPDQPTYFALSSGTTGNSSKRIPVTEEMIEAIRAAGLKQVFALNNFELPADFFEKEIMMLGSSTNLERRNDFVEGEISGISAGNIPFWFRSYYKPGEEIAKIEDWDQRVELIAERAADWDIGALSGIPSWIELMLQKVIAHHNLKNIHEIWPNLRVYTSGGVAFGPYKKSFNDLLGHPITVINTYLASEGFIACQTRPETNAMQLITDNGIFFEFVPFKPEYIKEDGSLTPTAPAITLNEAELDKDYVLIISTVSGAWRYIIGDTIKFTNLERAEIQITGRTKFFLNTVGSQLSVNKMDDAMEYLEEVYEAKIPEYTICAKRCEDGEFYHCWYLGSNLTEPEEARFSKSLDEYLMEANKNYRVAREKSLKGVKVKVVPIDYFYDWNAKNKKKGGQVKMERVMNEEKFTEWENFVRSKV